MTSPTPAPPLLGKHELRRDYSQLSMLFGNSWRTQAFTVRLTTSVAEGSSGCCDSPAHERASVSRCSGTAPLP